MSRIMKAIYQFLYCLDTDFTREAASNIAVALSEDARCDRPVGDMTKVFRSPRGPLGLWTAMASGPSSPMCDTRPGVLVQKESSCFGSFGMFNLGTV